MNRFLTLVRKDLADYRGALVWTPLVVAAIVFVLALISAVGGRFEPGFDLDKVTQIEDGENVIRDPVSGQITINGDTGETVTIAPPSATVSGKLTVKGENGETVAVDLDPKGEPRIRVLDQEFVADGRHTVEETRAIRTAAALAPAVGALLPLGIAAVVILFVFLGSLYDERKDRSILFWKSMPVGDHATVLSKGLTIGALGLGAALVAGFALHTGLNLITFTILAQHGFGWVGADTIGLMLQVWAALAATVLVYLLWVTPVYAWLLFASAASPKAPILLGLVPFALIPLAAQVVGLYNEWLLEPIARLTGQSMGEAFGRVVEIEREFGPDAIDFGLVYQALGQNLLQPGLWLGLIVAAGLLYAAAEVRRRKAL